LATFAAENPKCSGRQPVDAVLVTHAHVGHYLGLAMFSAAK